MSNPLPTASAPSGPQTTPVALSSSIAGRKRKTGADDTPEHKDEGFVHPQLSNAKISKRAKLAHGAADVPAPAAKINAPAQQSVPPPNTSKPRKSAIPITDGHATAAAASKDRKKRQPAPKASGPDAGTSGEGQDMDMVDTPEELSVPPPKTAKPPKKKKSGRKQKSKPLPIAQKTDDQNTEDAANDTTTSAAQGADKSSHDQDSKTISAEQKNDDEEMDDQTPAASTPTSGPISLAMLAAGAVVTGKFANSARDLMLRLAGATNNDAQPSVTAAQSPAPVDAEDEEIQAPVPLLAPDVSGVSIAAFFKLPLPAKVEPWIPKCPQAYGRYGTNVDSLVNWDVVQRSGKQGRFGVLTPIDRRSYDLRAAWNRKPLGWTEVKAAYNKEANTTLSNECLRQHFENANQIIFAATGVFFGSLGLKDDYGIPLDLDWKNANAGKTSKTKLTKEVDPNAELKKAWRKALGFKVPRVVQFLIRPLSGSVVTRIADARIIEHLGIDSSKDVRCTEATFDRWYSCICFGTTLTFPMRVFQLRKFEGELKGTGDDVYYTGDLWKHTDEGTPPITIQILLDTYCLSQSMGTTAVSDMILDEILQVLENEKAIATKYSQGSICEGDCNTVIRFQDLLPQDIEKLWIATNGDDPIRYLVFSLLTGLTANENQRFLVADSFQAALIARNL
jgi:hypothetical protein